MHFAEWYENQKRSERGASQRLIREHELSPATLARARAGEIRGFALAKRISDITSGAVSVEELCSGPPAPKRPTPKRPIKRGRPDRVLTRPGFR